MYNALNLVIQGSIERIGLRSMEQGIHNVDGSGRRTDLGYIGHDNEFETTPKFFEKIRKISPPFLGANGSPN